MKKILVTGANGFVGSALTKMLHELGFMVKAATRSPSVNNFAMEHITIGKIDSATEWCSVLADCDIVVHLAARVHVVDRTDLCDHAFHATNVEGTLNLARQAAACGVRRFIFTSTIKVNGETTLPGLPFRADDPPVPRCKYGVSKFHAENGLRKISDETGMEVVIIRPPLVYGPNPKANLATLIRCVRNRCPLPFGSIKNKRSFVAIENLIDLIIKCISNPAAANQVFLVSDGESISTTQLIKRIGFAMEVSPILIPFPVKLLRWILRCIGRGDLATRLFDSLEVDISKNREILDWTPMETMGHALKRALIKK